MSKKDTLGERMQSACRLRHIRENAGLTQEQFAEVLGISVSAYKKVESGENQVSISSLSKLYKEMHVSTDYVLFGKNIDLNAVWNDLLNCLETDKLFVLLRLLIYFTEWKKGVFPLGEEITKEEQEFLHIMQKLQSSREEL